MAYNPTTGLITPPVSINDVQRALGIGGGGDVGTLIRTGNINMWAKYKPVPYRKLSVMTDADFADAEYGLSIPLYSKLYDMCTAVVNGTAGWSYNKPAGGLNTPYRLPDFANYDHDVSKWMLNDKWNIILGGTVWIGNGPKDNMEVYYNDRVIFTVPRNDDGELEYGKLLYIDDFDDIDLSSAGYMKDWYGGIAFYCIEEQTMQRCNWIVSDQTIGTNGIDIFERIKTKNAIGGLSVGRYAVIPFITDGTGVTKGQWSAGNFTAGCVSLNNAKFIVVRSSESAQQEKLKDLTITVTSLTASGGNSVVTVQFENNRTTAYSLSEAYLLLASLESYDTYDNPWDAGWIDQTSTAYGSVTYVDQIRQDSCYTSANVGTRKRYARTLNLQMTSIPTGTTTRTFTVPGIGDSYGNFDKDYSPFFCMDFNETDIGRIVM